MHRHSGRHGHFHSHDPSHGQAYFHEHIHAAMHAIGRHHRGGGGFGRFGFGGGMGMGPESFRGRKMGSVDLRLVLLTLLEQRPSHGYELIKALEDRSGGFYSPSPGMVYPALTWLEEVGYASVTAEGAKKLYNITAEGQAYLAEHKAAAEAILGQLEQIAKRLGHMREAVAGFEDDAAGPKDVWTARHELKEALRACRGASAEEASRIAQILKDAAAKIRNRS
jgi:DNA-binding PadR family transcriptional regulator